MVPLAFLLYRATTTMEVLVTDDVVQIKLVKIVHTPQNASWGLEEISLPGGGYTWNNLKKISKIWSVKFQSKVATG